MVVVKVQYTVSDDYVETNKRNIRQVMTDLRELKNDGIRYSAFVEEDGHSFMHFAVYPDEATLGIVTDLPAFKKFQMELKASNPISPPKAENYSLVASSYLQETVSS